MSANQACGARSLGQVTGPSGTKAVHAAGEQARNENSSQGTNPRDIHGGNPTDEAGTMAHKKRAGVATGPFHERPELS
jgi:hypothetical protein